MARQGNLFLMSASFSRKATKRIRIGNIVIGGGSPIAIQSMTNTRTSDIGATVGQIGRLRDAGCEIVRVSVPDEESAAAIARIKADIDMPLVADVHFRAELAVAAIEAGADKIRINPGNIGAAGDVAKVVEAAAKAGIPIRVGVNSGSLTKAIRSQEGTMAQKLFLSAMENIAVIEALGFDQMVVSVKSPDVMEAVAAYRLLSSETDYPLHVGITESGTLESGSIKSAVGLGILLAAGIGDTIRVSLTADPVHEIHAARQILQSLGIRRFFPEIISCPTCARCEVDLIPIAEKLENYLKSSSKLVKVAVMGCVVNGPGEAADADIGLAAGKGKGVIFKGGQAQKTISEDRFLEELIKAVEEL